ncbi:MAG: ankyrin repeat domain-containing protein [Fretibacterium sp.]|nr:ankyrin repeat domain-containing protein [Fretibacterium sp.]
MKRILCVVTLCAAVLALPFEALAGSDLKDVLTDVGVTILREAIKNPGTAGRKMPEETQPEKELPEKKSPPVTKLSEEQYREIVEILQAGSLEDFKAKLEDENISPNATHEKGMGYDFLLNIAAAESSNPEIVRFLINDMGIDVNQYQQDDVPWPALCSAVCREDPRLDVVEALIQAGAEVNALGGDDGSSVLMFAAKSGTPEVLKLLIDSGAKVDLQIGDYNFTALIAAASGSEKPENVITLLKAGANARIRDRWGKRAVDYARQNSAFRGTKALKMLEEASGQKKVPAKKTTSKKTGGRKSTKKSK